MKVYIETNDVSSFTTLPSVPATGTQPYSRIEQTALRMKKQYFKTVPDYPILRGKNGKPYFAQTDSLFFSGSHTKNFLVTAMAKSNLAIDIEQYRSKHFQTIAAHAFTEYEQRQLARSKTIEKDFFLLWTIKEADIKLQGATVFTIKNAVRLDIKNKCAYCGEADTNSLSITNCIAGKGRLPMKKNSSSKDPRTLKGDIFAPEKRPQKWIPYKHTIFSFHLTKQSAQKVEHFIASMIITGQHPDISVNWHHSTVSDERIIIERIFAYPAQRI